MVVCPTRTPATSVMAFWGPGCSTPGVTPRSRARGRCWAAVGSGEARARIAAGRSQYGFSRRPWVLRIEAKRGQLGSEANSCRRVGTGQRRLEPVDEQRLRGIDFLAGGSGIVPGATVHLGESDQPPRSAGPLGPHGVAGHPVDVGITLPGPPMHQLACLLPDAAQ